MPVCHNSVAFLPLPNGNMSPALQAGPAYIEAFLSVLKNVTKDETVQYVLALLVQMLATEPRHVKLFHQQSDMHMSSVPEPFTVFARLLQRTDWFTQVGQSARPLPHCCWLSCPPARPSRCPCCFTQPVATRNNISSTCCPLVACGLACTILQCIRVTWSLVNEDYTHAHPAGQYSAILCCGQQIRGYIPYHLCKRLV